MKFPKKFACIIAVILLLCSSIIPAAAAVTVVASPTQSAVFINGAERKFEAYCIGGSNYFRLRDLACALSGTSKEFQVTFDDQNNQVVLTSQMAYTAFGDEMSVSGGVENVNAEQAAFDIYLDGKKLTLTAYLIGSSNYVKLRELAAALDFGVTYVAETNTIQIDTASGYTPVETAMTFPSDLSITFIGDSVGAGVAPYLKKYFPNAYIDAKASRQFYAAIGIVEALLKNGKLSSTVVIGLGTKAG